MSNQSYKNKIQTEKIINMFSDGEDWKLGLENGKTIYEVMDGYQIKFSDTPEGRELRNRFYNAMCCVAHYFKNEYGLAFGGIKIDKGTPKKYIIAGNGYELGKLKKDCDLRFNAQKQKRKFLTIKLCERLTHLKENEGDEIKLIQKHIAKK